MIATGLIFAIESCRFLNICSSLNAFTLINIISVFSGRRDTIQVVRKKKTKRFELLKNIMLIYATVKH